MSRRALRAVGHTFALLMLWCLAQASQAAPGLVGRYYNSTTPSGTPALVRVDNTVDFNWGTGSPGTGVNSDSFSVRWTGTVMVATTGSYTFQTTSDDGVRLYVNGALVINNWTTHSATTDTSAAVALTAGVSYTVALEYYENTIDSVIQLRWKKPGDASYSTIPASNGSLGLSTGIDTLLEYRFEQYGYNGTTNEVTDTSGSGNDGTALGLSSAEPGTSRTSPAVGTSNGTCRYGVFDRATKQYVAVSGSLPNLPNLGSFTISAWIRTTDRTQSGQRIVIQDESGNGSNSNGWIFSLGDRGAGMLNFLTRQTTAAVDETVTASVIANDTWYFVAAGVDGASKRKFILVLDVAGNVVANVGTTFTQAGIGPVTGTVSIGGETNSASLEATSSFGFAGNIDEVRIHAGALTTAELSAIHDLSNACGGLVASYRFEEASTYNGTAGELKDIAGAGGGPYNGVAQGTSKPSTASSAPARSGGTGTCGYASFPGPNSGGGYFTITGLPVATAAGDQNSVAFWLYWNGTDDTTPLSFNVFNLWFISGVFGFNTGGNDVYATSSSGLSGGWHHVVAVFKNGSTSGSRLYIDGAQKSLTQYVASPSNGNAYATSTMRIGTWSNSPGSSALIGRVDEVRLLNYGVSAAEVAALYAETHACSSLHHLEIRHGSGSGLTCTPSTLTVAACQDAACTTTYTGGLSGTLTATGSVAATWPTGAGFAIPAGSSTVTEDLQVLAAGSVVLGITGPSVTPSSSTTCNFGSPSCTFTAADSGLLFDVPNHRAEASNSVAVTAVKKSDNTAACVPAFASVSKALNFKCTYVNPTTGTQAVRVGGAALNSGNNAAGACDGTGQSVTLAFDATGKATTTVAYADAGTMSLSATYTGSGADAGLVLTGNDSFTAAPYVFTVTGPAAGNIAAGNNFAGAVTAKNVLGNAMPNFGKETSPEGATLGWVRTQPQGSAAVNGSFSGSLGAFGSGAASSSTLKWSEVGRGELSAVLTSGSYLGSGLLAAGATNSMVACAAENGSCVLPTGVTAVIYFGANGWFVARAGQTGSVACNVATFGDPIAGTTKSCSYVVTSGSSSASTGSIGPFTPHHFDVTATRACSATFSYAGQAFTTTVTARNASSVVTLNYDGSANTSPNFAKATTLADVPALGLGSWSGNAVAASAYVAGVASATPSYAFTSKTTAPQSLVIRATDADAVSSLNFAEPTMPLRSGRLAVSNAFGSEKLSLAIPVQAQYWSGLAWVQNSADSCTTVPAAAVVRAAYRDGKGAASAAWTSSASAITISAGTGTLTLGAPSPTSTGSVDFALNLGASTTDQSCLAAHPASTGAGLAWLRSQNGACSTAWDRDPSARASFGIYTPETRKTIHVRELF